MFMKIIVCFLVLYLSSMQRYKFKLKPEGKIVQDLPAKHFFQEEIEISSFKNEGSNVNTKICEVDKKQRMLEKKVDKIALHPDYDEWEKIKKDGIISSLQDLEQFQYVQDMVTFNGTIMVFFENLTISIFNLTKQGKIEFVNSTTVEQNIEKGTVYLKANDQYCFMVSRSSILRIHSNGQLHKMTGFQPIGQHFTNAQFYQNQLIILSGSQGMYHYKISEKSFQLIIHYNLSYKGETISPVNIDFDENNFYIVDSTKGLFSFSRNQIRGQSVVELDQILRLRGCHNLLIHQGIIYLQCKHFLTYNIKSEQFKTESNYQIYPQQMLKNETTLYFIASGAFGVSEYIDFGIQVSSFSEFVQKTVVFGQYLVSVDEINLFSWKPIQPKYKLQCQLNKNKKKNEGQNIGKLIRKSVCNGNICEEDDVVVIDVEYPSDNHYLEIFATIILVWWGCFCGIWLSVKHIKIRKQYNELQEETTMADFSKSDVQVSYQTNITEPQIQKTQQAAN